jgi:OOP family OmpA-OmpF porin
MMCRASSLLLALLLSNGVARGDASAPIRFVLDGDRLELPTPIRFETNSDKLRPESDPVLAHVAAYLDARLDVSLLRIEVHSDAMGAARYNQALSERRALAVARALVARGIDCKRLLPVGFGDTRPLAPNTTEAGRARNRRTVFVNAALRGRPIGAAPVDGGGHVAGDPCR